MPQPQSVRISRILYVPEKATFGRAPSAEAAPEYLPPLARMRPPLTSLRPTEFEPDDPVHMTAAQPITVSNANYDGPDPYVEYSRRFTAEGGVKLTYRTIDESVWRTILAAIAWLGLMAASGWFLLNVPPFIPLPDGCYLDQPCRGEVSSATVFLDLLIFIGLGWISGWLLFQDVWVSRNIEIRPDCLILDDTDVFWAQNFETLPAFRANDEGSHVLAATYGTRTVDLLEVKAFDEADRTQSVLANHINTAIQQLWFRPLT